MNSSKNLFSKFLSGLKVYLSDWRNWLTHSLIGIGFVLIAVFTPVAIWIKLIAMAMVITFNIIRMRLKRETRKDNYMKKFLTIGMIYAIFALACGVYFREFTKFNNFTEPTMLAKAHPHLFMLGAMMFIFLSIFADRYDLSTIKGYKLFSITYNFGLILTIVMMLVRGTFEVIGTTLSNGASATISGIAGIGHIVTSIGIVSMFLMLRQLGNNN